MEKFADKSIAQQTELAFRLFESFEISPALAAILYSKLIEPQFSPASISEIIESDPALAAKVFSLLYNQKINIIDEDLTLRQAVNKLPAQILKDAIFSIPVSPSGQSDSYRNTRNDLIKHSVAVGLCARKIAELISLEVNAEICFCAGLMHDIGKIAMEQAMPKSFAIISQQAKQQECSSTVIEQKHLGLDHAILGKKLAQKWHFPSEIQFGIWLHHSDTNALSQNVPEAQIAQVVQLADLLVRKYQIADSGSYDLPEFDEELLQTLGIGSEQLEEIGASLEDELNKKLSWQIDAAQAAYMKSLHDTALKLAKTQSKLAQENQKLQTASSHLQFITDFLSNVSSTDLPMDIAENFATRWQKFYQTGMVCLYLAPQANSNIIEAAVIENLSQSRVVVLEPPEQSPAIASEIAKNFGVFNAYQHIGWLFEQLDVEFNIDQTKLMPLQTGGKTIGAIAFEQRYPSDLELFLDNFKMVTSVAAIVLDLAIRGQSQEQFAERFLQLLGQSKKQEPQIIEEKVEVKEETKPEVEQTYSLNTLAEMAAGAAHELNNPLAVISGRAQLLAQAETDADKKRMLKQIQDNASEITRIVEDLMAFANPPSPKPMATKIEAMLDEAVQLAALKQNVEKLNIQIDVDDSAGEIFADSAQVASAVANILCNSLQSYSDKNGEIKISAQANNGDGLLRLEITDFGDGMDELTLRKATQPFFSNRPAGRSRGMGLAHTNRLIALNGGTLNISSQPGTGTTVTILLPMKS